jgi:hypothetical protein
MTEKGLRSVFRSGNEVHEGPEAPSSGSAEEMQSFDGGLEPGTEARETIHNLKLLKNARTQESIASDVDGITGAQDYVVNQASGVVTEG